MASEKEDNRFLTIFFGHLAGVTKKDAISYILATADSHLSGYEPEECGYDLIKWRDGYLYQLSAGGDKQSRLKSIASILDSNPPGTKVHISTSSRQAELLIKPDSSERPIYRLLTESDSNPETELAPGVRLKAIEPGYDRVLFSGVMVVIAGVMMLVLAGYFTSLLKNREVDVAKTNEAKKIANLPEWHLPSGIALQPGQYIESIRFENGHWLAPQIKCGTEACKQAKQVQAQPNKIRAEAQVKHQEIQ